MKNRITNIQNFTFISLIVACMIIFPIILTGCLEPVIPEITAEEEGAEKLTRNTITVIGNGSIKILPDEVSVNISVLTEEPTTEEAVNKNSTISKEIISQIETIDAENLKIESISYELYPVYDYSSKDKPPKIYAYRVLNTIKASTTDLEKIGEIIATATETGATDISSIGFDITEETRKKAKNDALAKATLDASEKASAIVNAMGLVIDSVLYITEGEVYIPVMAPLGLGEIKAEEAAPPQILPREIEVTASINIVYSFTR
ncbi:MAG: DUF541 domain-containing protein [Actinobacteria bacterium]|nr:DUF541 domain-containing protein [Actinomycetota bacterium]MBM3712533.1 DUF541 domain-containing protein [Actinomycetota bacterium]